MHRDVSHNLITEVTYEKVQGLVILIQMWVPLIKLCNAAEMEKE